MHNLLLYVLNAFLRAVVTSGLSGHYVYRVQNAEGQDIYSVEQSKIGPLQLNILFL